MTPELQHLYDCVMRALQVHAKQLPIDKKIAISTDAVLMAKEKTEGKRE